MVWAMSWLMRSLTLVLTLSIAGCSDDPPDGDTAAEFDKEQLFALGDHPVGYRQLDVTYAAAATGEDRVLATRVWYPAIAAAEEPAQYSVAGIVSLPATNALAEPALAEGTFPVAIYSHGFGGEGLLAYPYAELFASHGWIVVAPNHTGNTALDGLTGTLDPFASNTLNRPHDITAVLDWLEQLSGDPLAGAASTDAVFVFGHSFGGYTTFAAGGVDLDVDALTADCEGMSMSAYSMQSSDIDAAYRAGFGDSRVRALGPQAPALVPSFGDGQLAALDMPTLLMSGRKDISTTDEEQSKPAWEGLDHPDDIWVELPDGAHLSFISVCDDLAPALVASFQPTAEMDGCGPEFVPVSESVPALGAYMLAFAREQVLGEQGWSALLRGDPMHPAVAITLP